MEIMDSKERIGTIEDSQAPLFDTTHNDYEGLELKKMFNADGRRNLDEQKRSINDKVSIDIGANENGNYDIENKSYSSNTKESQKLGKPAIEIFGDDNDQLPMNHSNEDDPKY